jgi:hypothetical protein
MQKNCRHGINQNHHHLFENRQILISYQDKSTSKVS